MLFFFFLHICVVGYFLSAHTRARYLFTTIHIVVVIVVLVVLVVIVVVVLVAVVGGVGGGGALFSHHVCDLASRFTYPSRLRHLRVLCCVCSHGVREARARPTLCTCAPLAYVVTDFFVFLADAKRRTVQNNNNRSLCPCRSSTPAAEWDCRRRGVSWISR